MRRLASRVLRGMIALIHRNREERDLDEELGAYLEAAVERHMQAGLSREAATRAARIETGSVTAVKDHVRDAGWESRLDDLWQDVRYAVRTLRHARGFTAVAVLTLALAIGANTAIFSVVNGLLLRSLPVRAPEELQMVSTRHSIEEGFPAGWNYAMWDQIRQRKDAFGGAIAWTVFTERFDLARAGEVEPADGLFVSWDLFQELGVPPLLGRTFAANEDSLAAPDSHVAVISYGFWQRRFAGAADVVGKTLSVNRVPVTIVGVTPPEFFGPEVGRAFDIAMPIGAGPVILNEPKWGSHEGRSYLAVMLRLRPGQSRDAAEARLRSQQRQIVTSAMPSDAFWGPVQDDLMKDPLSLVPASTGTSELRRQYSRAVVTVLVIAGLVLLIACANIANLLLARSATRHRELGVRVALGAPRRRLVQLMLAESLILAGLGAAAGLLLATWAGDMLVAQMSTWSDRVTLDVSLDGRVVAFTVFVTVATALLFGAAPAFRASRVAPVSALKDSITPLHVRERRVPMRSGLVVTQVALSLVLVIAAGLFIRTFERLLSVPLGFQTDGVLVVEINASRTAEGPGVRAGLYQQMASAVAELPGVAHAAVSLNTPANRGVTLVVDYRAPGRPDLAPRERRAIVNYVTPGWFEAYRTPIRGGRFIELQDTTQSPAVTVVNEAFVRRFFDGHPAVNATIVDAMPFPGVPAPVPKTIVGVVGNAIEQSLRYEAYPTVYLPLAQWATFMPEPAQISLSVRATSGSPVSLSRSVAKTLTAIDSRLAFTFRPLEEQIDAARHQERLIAWLSTFFGGLALLLAAIGLFGIASSTVVRRRKEIGIRMALGAQRRAVVGRALRQTILATLAGLTIGLLAAVALTRYLEAMLFGITPLDPVTFIAAPAILGAVALLACFLPAHRATTIDPMAALRCE